VTATSDAVGTARRDQAWRVAREAALIAVIYIGYTLTRNQFAAGADEAFDNARRVIRWENAIGLFVEPEIQDAFLPYRWFIGAWNLFYASFHFVVTVAVLAWAFFRHPARYPRYRTILAVGTVCALIGYATFPLAPPRLTPGHGFVDTLAHYWTLWNFESGPAQKLSNQYAAMPSLHFGWSTWVAITVWGLAERRWVRVLAVLYPVATLFAIVVTGNHYWLDAVGGAAVMAVGWLVATAIHGRPPARAAQKIE
jgi:hypothetical protein